jgi:thiol-disulfide isomerase/thioredoxin
MAWAVELLGPTLMVHDSATEVVARPTAEVVAGKKFVALYFSAQCVLWRAALCGHKADLTSSKRSTHVARLITNAFALPCSWCPPCRGFTPIFADLYKQQSAGKVVEVRSRAAHGLCGVGPRSIGADELPVKPGSPRAQ